MKPINPGFEDKLKDALRHQRSHSLFATEYAIRRIEEQPLCTVKNTSETTLNVIIRISYADAFFLCPKTQLHVDCEVAGNTKITFTRAALDRPYNGPGVVLGISSIHVGDMVRDDLCDALGQCYEITPHDIKRVHTPDNDLTASWKPGR